MEEYMKTLDTNLAPLSEALGTMMECNKVNELHTGAGVLPLAGTYFYTNFTASLQYCSIPCTAVCKAVTIATYMTDRMVPLRTPTPAKALETTMKRAEEKRKHFFIPTIIPTSLVLPRRL